MKGIRKSRRQTDSSHDWSLLLFVLLAVIGAGLIAYQLWPEPAPTAAPIPAPTVDIKEPRVQEIEAMPPPTVVEPAPEPLSAPLDPVRPDLPSLDASDELLRQEALEVTTQPDFHTWVAPEELIRRFVVIVDNLAVGNSPTRELEFMALEGRFSATLNDDGHWVTHRKSFARYNLITEIFKSINVDICLQLFQRWYPLFQEAYVELGYPDAEFKEALRGAIKELLETPTPKTNPTLIQRTGRYE
ncbi:MAG: DUF3014 domain-containing protein, partial [Deltaproteobacteria bacterium]|nr:DUF3014 domain-containing protein [Deltaproteobacteria bacterium]